jgi:hypothetical protein
LVEPNSGPQVVNVPACDFSGMAIKGK